MSAAQSAARLRRIRTRRLLEPFGLSGDATLLLRDLLRLALQVGGCPLPGVCAATSHLLFETTQLVGGALAASRRRLRIVALHLAGGLPHLLGGAAHAGAPRLPLLLRARLRLTTLLACPLLLALLPL